MIGIWVDVFAEGFAHCGACGSVLDREGRHCSSKGWAMKKCADDSWLSRAWHDFGWFLIPGGLPGRAVVILDPETEVPS